MCLYCYNKILHLLICDEQNTFFSTVLEDQMATKHWMVEFLVRVTLCFGYWPLFLYVIEQKNAVFT